MALEWNRSPMTVTSDYEQCTEATTKASSYPFSLLLLPQLHVVDPLLLIGLLNEGNLFQPLGSLKIVDLEKVDRALHIAVLQIPPPPSPSTKSRGAAAPSSPGSSGAPAVPSSPSPAAPLVWP